MEAAAPDWTIKLKHLERDVQNLQGKTKRVTWYCEDLKGQINWIERVDEICRKVIALSNNYQGKGACTIWWFRHCLNKEVEKINQEISQLNQEGAKYYNPKSRTELLDEIMAALKDPYIEAVGVWGLGGGGTTSLAKQVGDKVKEQGLFDEVVFTTIVGETGVEQIQKDIATQLGVQFHEETRVERRDKLRQRIKKEKKILVHVVVDDFWAKRYDQNFDLEELGVHLGDECKLLITSGNLDFIKNMRGNLKVFQLEVLLEDEALSLFHEIVNFSKGYPVIGMIRRCAGSSLSTFVIAKALTNMGKRGRSNALILRLTLELLNQNVPPLKIFLDSLFEIELKDFFLLLTIRGRRVIHKSSLLFDMWRILFQNLRTLEDARNKCDSLINDLKAYGLVVEDGKEWVKIVDSIWETAYSIAKNDLSSLMISGSWPPKEWRGIFLFCHVTIISGFQIPKRLPSRNLKEIVLHTQSPSIQVPNSFFEETKLLKVLDFVGFDCSKLPSSIGLLKDLQVLSMSNCKLGDITIFGELTNLEILSLQRSHIQQLPRQIGQLQKLRFLDLRDTYLQVIPPNVLKNLTSLEELYMKNSFSKWEVERSNNEKCYASLKELTNLHRLTHIEDLYVPNQQAWPVDLYFKNLKSYTIFIGDGWEHTHDGDHRLKTLKLKLNRMFQSEEGIKKMLKVVDVLYLDELNGVQNVLSDLGSDGLPYLKSLVVQHNAEIKCIAKSSSQSLDDVDVFPNLESLSLYNLRNLEHICHGVLTTKSFFRLRVIKVHKCNGLTYLLSNSMFRGSPCLVDIEVSECNHIKAVFIENVSGFAINISELRYLTLRGLPKFVTFSFSFPHSTLLFDGQLSLDKLKVLRVINQDIEQLWHHSCPPKSLCELEDLTLSDNNKLLSVISSKMIMRFNHLKKLNVHRCKLLTAVFDLEDGKSDQAIETMIPQLMVLGLSNLCSLSQIWYKEPKVPFFQKLVSLHIVHCGNLKSVFSLPAVKNLTQLRLLKLYSCEKLIEVIEDDGDDENLSITFPKVECLILKDLQNLVSFHGQSKRTLNWPKLQTIRVSNVGRMVTFFDGVLNTPLLRTVWVPLSLKSDKDGTIVVNFGRIGCHPNVIPLRAYYYSKDEIVLVYDYYSIMKQLLGSVFEILSYRDAQGSGMQQLEDGKLSICYFGRDYFHSVMGVIFLMKALRFDKYHGARFR